MKIITAIENYEKQENDIICFLAGGITNCPDWQSEVIDILRRFDDKLPNLVVFNPRRANFPINDPNASKDQIAWEFKWLQQMDIFSMYFTGGTSDQPICLYELGRNLYRMMVNNQFDYEDRIIISCDPNYKRAADVKEQVQLAIDADEFDLNKYNPEMCKIDIKMTADPMDHAIRIINSYKKIIDRINGKKIASRVFTMDLSALDPLGELTDKPIANLRVK